MTAADPLLELADGPNFERLIEWRAVRRAVPRERVQPEGA
jgi:hypothetical protein